MGKYQKFNEFGAVIDIEREKLCEIKRLREERLTEINAEFDELEAGYAKWFEENLPKYKELARAVFQASEFRLVDVAHTTADIVSAFKGEEYFFRKATMVHYVGRDKTKTTQVLDAVVARDSVAYEYSPIELNELIRQGKMIVLADNHIDNATFNFYESDEEGNLKFTTRFDGFEFVTDFFKSVIAKRVEVRPEIHFSSDSLVAFANQYLLDNIDKINDSYIDIDKKDEEEYERSIQIRMEKLNDKKEFRAKQLAKIRELKPIDC